MDNNGQQAASSSHVITKDVLENLVRQLTDNPDNRVNEDGSAEILIRVADDLIDQAVMGAGNLARHRGSDTIDLKDVKLYFQRNFNGLEIAGFPAGDNTVKP